MQSPRYSWRMAFFSEHFRGSTTLNRQQIIIIFTVYNFDKVGGLHLRDPSPLPDNLQQLLDKSSQVLKSLSNDGIYIGRKLTTNTKVPGNIHKPEFRDFWLKKHSVVMWF